MFGLLKKRFSKLVESVSDKFKKKEETTEKIEEIKKEIEEKIEPVEEKPIEEVMEEIKPVLEERVPEIKEEVKAAVEEVKEEVKPEVRVEGKKSFFKRITEKIVKKVTEKELSEEELEPILNELETGLIEADAAYEVAEKIKKDLRTALVGREIKRGKEKEVVLEGLKKSLLEILSVPRIDLEEIIRKSRSENRPALFLFFGINGVGKSLNLSKVAKYLKDRKYRPILAAGDTFRAMGSEQLEKYGEMIEVSVISQKRGSDSCAVIFDARKSAEAKGYDVVLGDTSGRMHTKKDLLDELGKIIRVNKPDLKILVLDSLSGSDVVHQFEFFDKVAGIDAVIFSKVDVNEKGGNILSICHNFKRPILFLGMGQSFDDLTEFNPEKLVNNFLS